MRRLALDGAVRRVGAGLTGLGRLTGLARVHRLAGLSRLSVVLGLSRLGRGVVGCGGLLIRALALLVRGGRLREAVAALDGHRPLALPLTGRAGRRLTTGVRIAVVGRLRSRGPCGPGPGTAGPGC
ncbi:hypothetical protein SSPO_033010 [Streptomyces antimycoticus]|uniref:Uncharacterized protein n=1 Tax=Streptomyces antimycoticus TaxID=68175 RepID=A0A499UGK8_9ACTN|nr:hypothetical protein SSPO_033010 [Streptomyces antimycoticus]